MSGAMGTTEIKDGKVDGDTLSWSLDMTVPMPMTLDRRGDRGRRHDLNGTVTAGAFGSFPMTGTRAG